MSTRLDLVLQKYPEHEEQIRLIASRDPSGNLKYLDWGARMLASRQALTKEIADVIDLFHQLSGQRFGRGRERIRSDIYAYRANELAELRNNLLKIKRAKDRKRRKRELLYRIEGTVEADTVYDSTDLIVRHIKNKQASVHYGLGTKWCIAMLREGYFEEYEAHNATFFFFERKAPIGDEFDKVALLVPRTSKRQDDVAQAFTSADRLVDMMSLAKVHGPRIFDIFRDVHERSERYPGSTMFRVYSGTATEEQLESAFASVVKGARNPYEADSILVSICCNDAASPSLLEQIAHGAKLWVAAAWKGIDQCLVRTVAAALVIHPHVPVDVREKLVKELRQRHISIDAIRRVEHGGRIAVSYRPPGERRRRHLRPTTVGALRARAKMLDRLAERTRKKAETLQRKLDKAGKKKKSRKSKSTGFRRSRT